MFCLFFLYRIFLNIQRKTLLNISPFNSHSITTKRKLSSRELFNFLTCIFFTRTHIRARGFPVFPVFFLRSHFPTFPPFIVYFYLEIKVERRAKKGGGKAAKVSSKLCRLFALNVIFRVTLYLAEIKTKSAMLLFALFAFKCPVLCFSFHFFMYFCFSRLFIIFRPCNKFKTNIRC